ncbi:MAG: nucleotidyltransferase substrate binding protein [Deltaproteobacteria bacterium]|nr:nucleotidyltransferase substrate binding protein [Deltaproteobacteria bacterium]
MKKTEQGLDNFFAALKKLEEFLAAPVVTERDKAGVIQAFEFAFELFWKAVQKFAQEEGLSANSPKQALKEAFQLKIIPAESEQAWLDMLKDRNLTSHMYDQSVADGIFERIRSSHFKNLKAAGKILQEKIKAS